MEEAPTRRILIARKPVGMLVLYDGGSLVFVKMIDRILVSFVIEFFFAFASVCVDDVLHESRVSSRSHQLSQKAFDIGRGGRTLLFFS
jgi:hypothetical protein